MRKTFEGLILSETVLKERDKILTILTAERGKVSVYARNVRSLKRGSLAYTMPFQHCRFEVEERTSGMSLINGDVLHSFYDITNDLAAFALGQYILNVTRELTVENNNEADMLRLTLNTLYLIQKGERSLQHIKATFEFRAMAISGYMPELHGCDICGCEDGEMLFDVMNGIIYCRECQKIRNMGEARPEDTGTASIVLQLTPSILKGLRYVLSAEPNRVFSYSIAEDEQADFSEVCEKYIINHLERGFTTLDFYHEVANM